MSKDLNKNVAALSERLSSHVKVDANTGAGHVPENLYNDTLPEGITPDIVRDVRVHDAHFVAAATHAFGTKAVEVLGANRNINQSSIDIPMGFKDSLHINVTGEVEQGEGKPSLFGQTTAILTTHAGTAGTQLKNAMHLVAEAADRAFANDEVTSE